MLQCRTFFTVYFCLGYRSKVKEARILPFFEFDMLDALQITIKLKKVKDDGLKVRQDNQALIVGPSSIINPLESAWMMFARVRW